MIHPSHALHLHLAAMPRLEQPHGNELAALSSGPRPAGQATCGTMTYLISSRALATDCQRGQNCRINTTDDIALSRKSIPSVRIQHSKHDGVSSMSLPLWWTGSPARGREAKRALSEPMPARRCCDAPVTLLRSSCDWRPVQVPPGFLVDRLLSFPAFSCFLLSSELHHERQPRKAPLSITVSPTPVVIIDR